MPLSGLDVVHDALVGGEHDVSELSGRQDLVEGLLEVLQLDIEPWGDDSALVDTPVELNDDLAVSLIVNNLKLVDVSMLLHDLQELDDDLGAWSDDDLSLSNSLGVDNGVENVSQYIHKYHG